MVPRNQHRAVLVATLSTMVVGSVWYTPKVFGNYWMRTAKVTPSCQGKDAIKPILITLVVSFVSALVRAGSVAIVQEFTGAVSGTTGRSPPSYAGPDSPPPASSARRVQGRPVGLTALNCAHELVTYLVMALVIGLFGTSANPEAPTCSRSPQIPTLRSLRASSREPRVRNRATSVEASSAVVNSKATMASSVRPRSPARLLPVRPWRGRPPRYRQTARCQEQDGVGPPPWPARMP